MSAKIKSIATLAIPFAIVLASAEAQRPVDRTHAAFLEWKARQEPASPLGLTASESRCGLTIYGDSMQLATGGDALTVHVSGALPEAPLLLAFGAERATRLGLGTACPLLQPTFTVPLLSDVRGFGNVVLPPTSLGRTPLFVQALQRVPGQGSAGLLASPALALQSMAESGGGTASDDGARGGQLGPQCVHYAPWELVGVAIAPNDRCYAFYKDGKRSIGWSLDLDAYAGASSYSLPPGYSTNDIVGIACSPQSKFYVFYKDGKRSVGTSTNLDAYEGPRTYALPAGLLVTEGDIAAVACAKSDSKIYTWFKPGWPCYRSKGWSRDLGAYDAATAFDPSPRNAYQINGIGIASDNKVYCWFSDRSRSVGTSLDLHAHTLLPAPTYELACK
ncbi:MAG: hypothetical protein R3F56_21140 [Planctomycetota bacterium]